MTAVPPSQVVSHKTRRLGLACLLAVAGVFGLDALLFRTGLYTSILEPDSAAGHFEMILHNVAASFNDVQPIRICLAACARKIERYLLGYAGDRAIWGSYRCSYFGSAKCIVGSACQVWLERGKSQKSGHVVQPDRTIGESPQIVWRGRPLAG